jgi:hypothetical protein
MSEWDGLNSLQQFNCLFCHMINDAANEWWKRREMSPNVFTRPSTTLVKGPSKHVGVSRIGASLIPDEFVECNGCKCRGRILDPWRRARIRRHSYGWTTKWKGGGELFAMFMSIPLRIKPIHVIKWQMNILFANESTLMEVLFPLSTTINCRVCRTRVASGAG